MLMLFLCMREALLREESEGEVSFWALLIKFVSCRFAIVITIAFEEQEI